MADADALVTRMLERGQLVERLHVPQDDLAVGRTRGQGRAERRHFTTVDVVRMAQQRRGAQLAEIVQVP